MSQQSSNPGGPIGRFKRILRGQADSNGQTRVQRRFNPPATPVPAAPRPETHFRFLPAFWTVTGVISLIVNGVVIAILLSVLSTLGTIQLSANDRLSGVLGGLYENFLKMDEATIRAQIPVNDRIPIDIVVPVKTTTRVILSEGVTIQNAHVRINTGSVNIDADASIFLPAGTQLPVTLDFSLPVKDSIPLAITVPANIPLSLTELHDPFVGLQDIFKPYYCLVEPNAVRNGVQICSPLLNP